MEDKKYEFLIVEKADGVCTIAFSNQEKRNALNLKMMEELLEVLPLAAEDKDVICIVLTGAGDKAFCSGADISLFGGLKNLADNWDYLRNTGGDIQRLIEKAEKPVIAAISGYCLAGGLELALCCDFIIASDNARFGLTEVNIGVLPGWGGTVRLPRAIPVRKARELIYTARFMDAEEALQCGLVNHVVPQDKLREKVKEITDQICNKSPMALRVAKDAINGALACQSIEAALSLERGSVMALRSSEDSREGITAWLQKRKPQYKGY